MTSILYRFLARDGEERFRVVHDAITAAPFCLRLALDDFGTRLAVAAEELQGQVVPVDVRWRAEKWGCVPLLSVGGAFEVEYPVEALRGSEVVPADVFAANGPLFFTVTPSESAPPNGGLVLSPVGAQASSSGLWVEVPRIPTGAPIEGCIHRLGAEYHDPGDVELTVRWSILRALAIDRGARLRDGEAFIEEAHLSASSMHRTPDGQLVHQIHELFPARHTPATAASLSLTAPTWAHHERQLAEASSRLGHEVRTDAWLHDHHMGHVAAEAAVDGGADRPDAGDLRGPDAANETGEPPPAPASGLFFSGPDRAVMRGTFSGAGAAGLVLDSFKAERILSPTPAQADELFACFGWRRGRITRRSTILLG